MESVVAKIVIAVTQLKDEEYWNLSVNYFIENILSTNFGVRNYYLTFFIDLHRSSNVERQRRLASDLMRHYLKVDSKQVYNGDKLTFVTYNLIVKSGLFAEYYLFFEPIYFKNDYNNSLIQSIINLRNLPLAEKYCLQQIQRNTQEEYNFDYFKLLAQIYTATKDFKKLALVLKETVLFKLSFEDYSFIDRHLEDGMEKDKWKAKVLSKTRQLAGYDKEAMIFSFQILDHEANYKKMTSLIDSNCPYEVIVEYADKLALSNRNDFLKNLIYRHDHLREREQVNIDVQHQTLKKLLDIVLKRYSREELSVVLKAYEKGVTYLFKNQFVKYLQENL